MLNTKTNQTKFTQNKLGYFFKQCEFQRDLSSLQRFQLLARNWELLTPWRTLQQSLKRLTSSLSTTRKVCSSKRTCLASFTAQRSLDSQKFSQFRRTESSEENSSSNLHQPLRFQSPRNGKSNFKTTNQIAAFQPQDLKTANQIVPLQCCDLQTTNQITAFSTCD